MGGCYARDRNLFSRGPPTELKSRQPESSPRDVMRVEQPERKENGGYVDFKGTSPRTWQWNSGMLKAPGGASSSNNNYKPLDLDEAIEEELDEEDKPKRGPSKAQLCWVEEWLESVESGELDVYTCLGLSNAFTWTRDTQKLLVKVFAVTVLQIVIPCIMLYMETRTGLTFEPAEAGKGFRAIGSALYLYSVYCMYNGALDECRSQLLNFCLAYQLPAGYWLPLLLGEISNVFVSFALVITLYIIYTDLTMPADLILNAVAVNFLGSVDAEFVNDEMKKDALKNFRDVTEIVLQSSDMNKDMDSDAEVDHQTLLYKLVRTSLLCLAFTGFMLSIVFFFAPSTDREGAGQIQGKGHTARCRK